MESSKFDINLNEIRCPDCNEQMPVVRIPENIQQLMWGGWTCPKCGCQMDKFGRSTDTSTS